MTNLERGLYCQSTSCKNLHEEIIPGSSFLLYTQSWKKKKSRKKKTPRGVDHKLDKSSHHSPSPTLSPHFLWQAHLYIAMQACTTTSSLTKSCQSVQSTSINSQKQVLLWQNLVHTYCHGALHTENQDYTLNNSKQPVLYTGVCKDISLFFAVQETESVGTHASSFSFAQRKSGNMMHIISSFDVIGCKNTKPDCINCENIDDVTLSLACRFSI